MFRHRHRKARKIGVRQVKPRFLLVCEDTKSSVYYLRGFRLSSAHVIPVGAGKNTLSLVRHAIEEAENFQIDTTRDQVWVVMDRDQFPQSDYDNAFGKARAHGIKVAYANECFELWYLLHFVFSTRAFSRKEIPSLLTKYLGEPYQKSDANIFGKLSARIEIAIANASRLESHHISCGAEKGVHNCNPSTTVHLLVSELNKFL